MITKSETATRLAFAKPARQAERAGMLLRRKPGSPSAQTELRSPWPAPNLERWQLRSSTKPIPRRYRAHSDWRKILLRAMRPARAAPSGTAFPWRIPAELAALRLPATGRRRPYPRERPAGWAEKKHRPAG